MRVQQQQKYKIGIKLIYINFQIYVKGHDQVIDYSIVRGSLLSWWVGNMEAFAWKLSRKVLGGPIVLQILNLYIQTLASWYVA